MIIDETWFPEFSQRASDYQYTIRADTFLGSLQTAFSGYEPWQNDPKLETNEIFYLYEPDQIDTPLTMIMYLYDNTQMGSKYLKVRLDTSILDWRVLQFTEITYDEYDQVRREAHAKV